MNVYETKRYEPDFSYESGLPGMFETSKGGYVAHGDYATLFSELEVVKAERDALAVERDAARNALASIYKTATGELPEWSNWHAYLDDIVEEVGAKLAALQAQGVEKLINLKMEQLANMHPDTHAFGAAAESLRAQITWLQVFAIELREAK
jgi:hypothetical protein